MQWGLKEDKSFREVCLTDGQFFVLCHVIKRKFLSYRCTCSTLLVFVDLQLQRTSLLSITAWIGSFLQPLKRSTCSSAGFYRGEAGWRLFKFKSWGDLNKRVKEKVPMLKSKQWTSKTDHWGGCNRRQWTECFQFWKLMPIESSQLCELSSMCVQG